MRRWHRILVICREPRVGAGCIRWRLGVRRPAVNIAGMWSVDGSLPNRRTISETVHRGGTRCRESRSTSRVATWHVGERRATLHRGERSTHARATYRACGGVVGTCVHLAPTSGDMAPTQLHGLMQKHGFPSIKLDTLSSESVSLPLDHSGIQCLLCASRGASKSGMIGLW